ncbi:hypothetical protein OXYTRIMIC_518 [Oxytricha trifallax]|uniref:Uncharacterized protein n=1 Tax=Oxytricha trifallax TaxID=1172189 RepID=A0A073HZ58_9SPIT|nr:hypothetical protein OXYTRIMIC_518 [Oxytricha trifallax]
MLWQKADEDIMQSTQNSHIDNWDELVLGGAPRVSLDKEYLELEGKFSEMIGDVSEVENYIFNSKQHQQDIVNDAGQKNHNRDQDEDTRGNTTIRPKEKKEDEEGNDHKGKRMNQEENEQDKRGIATSAILSMFVIIELQLIYTNY